MDKFGLSQEEISVRVGKDLSTIANSVRLLKLPKQVKAALIEKKISPGHARSLLALNSADKQISVLQDLIRKGLNVRDTERLIKSISAVPAIRKNPSIDPYIKELEKRLTSRMMTKVRIKYGKRRGSIEITFSGDEELNRLISVLD